MIYPPHSAPPSGAQGLVGYRIDLSAPDGSALITLDVSDPHLNRNQTLHGGIHAMMLDAAAGFAASRYLAGDASDLVPVVTLSLTISFVGAAGPGAVQAHGQVRGGGRKIIYADAQITDANGALLSTASGVFRRAPGA